MKVRDGTDWKEGSEKDVKDIVLFEKYQLCRVIGTGQSGTVFLARHRQLEEYRVIKRVPKAFADYERFRREALILKELRHPGIPIVYDLEEDETYSYLIEEYLEGITLSALIQEQSHLSKAKVIRYGIQICRLVDCLHSAKPIPILYLDLQPKNLLLFQESVKLVDFNHAVPVTEANTATKRYGTIGWAAPEQYTKEQLDERTDIYAIGAVLYFLLTGAYPEKRPLIPAQNWGRELSAVISTCLETAKEDRYQSVKALCEELIRLECGVPSKQYLPSLTIACLGARPGAGVTHIAVGLSGYLARLGCSSLYEEKNQSGAVERLAGVFPGRRDEYGIFTIRGVRMKPDYGAAAALEPYPCQIRILDYGTNREAVREETPDAVILIRRGMWWNDGEPSCPDARDGGPGCIVVANQSMKPSAETVGDRILCPCFADPFLPGRRGRQFYRKLLSAAVPEWERGRRRKVRRFVERGILFLKTGKW